MANQLFNRETERSFAALQERVGELAKLCESLSSQYQALQAEQVLLLSERDALRAENQQSRKRIDTMVARLRGLEES